jgi:hypothetical protein
VADPFVLRGLRGWLRHPRFNADRSRLTDTSAHPRILILGLMRGTRTAEGDRDSPFAALGRVGPGSSHRADYLPRHGTSNLVSLGAVSVRVGGAETER